MKKKHLLIVSILFSSFYCNSQESLLKLTSKLGDYSVGFISINTYDYSRSFSPQKSDNTEEKDKSIFRPIQISVWYPTDFDNHKNRMKYEDYFYLQFKNAGNIELSNTSKNEFIKKFIATEPVSVPNLYNELKVEMHAIENAKEAKGTFPVIIYAPSWASTSFENALMFELLASHGYIVISSPSIGPYSVDMPLDELGVEAQARDVEFLISQVRNFSSANINKLALMGFSFGGLSNVFTLARNKSIDAWIGLDPSIHEDFEMFEKSPYCDFSSLSTPSLFINSVGFINSIPFYDKLIYSDAYIINLPKIEHTDLASQFIKLYGDDKSRSNTAIKTRNKAYNSVCHYVLQFLDGVFKEGMDYEMMTKSIFNEHKIDPTFMSINSKKALPKPKQLIKEYNNSNLIAFLNSKNVSGKYPKKDIQKLIFLLYNKKLYKEAYTLMEWFIETYKVDSYTNVLNNLNIDETVKMFVEVYKNNNESCDFNYDELNHTAQLFSMGDRKKEAIKYFLLNVKLNPKSYQAYFNLGIGFFRLNDFSNAKKQFNNCLNLNPDEKYFSLSKQFLKKCN